MALHVPSHCVIGLCIMLSCAYSHSLRRQYMMRQTTNRLMPQYWSQKFHHDIKQLQDDAFNDYINKLENYDINTAGNTINIQQFESDPELGTPKSYKPPTTNENIKSYLEAPGYTVKMNENVFRRYLSVLLELYGMNEKQEFRDGKEAIAELREELKDEAREFYGRPISSFRKLMRNKLNLYKWDILKAVAIEIPYIGDAVKLVISIVEHEQEAINRFLNEKWFERRARKKYHELKEEIHIGLGEPFPLYVMRHWRPSDEDPNSIYNIKLECPLTTKPQQVFDVPPKVVDPALLNANAGKCVVQRMDWEISDKKPKRNKPKREQKCIGANYEQCMALQRQENLWCHWQYCNCNPWKPFQDVPSHCDMMGCLTKTEIECGQSVGCEWG